MKLNSPNLQVSIVAKHRSVLVHLHWSCLRGCVVIGFRVWRGTLLESLMVEILLLLLRLSSRGLYRNVVVLFLSSRFWTKPEITFEHRLEHAAAHFDGGPLRIRRSLESSSLVNRVVFD